MHVGMCTIFQNPGILRQVCRKYPKNWSGWCHRLLHGPSNLGYAGYVS